MAGMFGCAVVIAVTGAAGMLPAAEAELIDVRRIWDQAPHNAFTDLARFGGRWWCVFREGRAHVSPDGALRVITSRDGKEWSSAALLTDAEADLRDPKLALTPDRRLMLTGAAAYRSGDAVRHQTRAWFSADGRQWSAPVAIGEPNLWLWRVVWHRRIAYGAGYDTAGEGFVRLYRSADGRQFEALVPRLFSAGKPNETALVFTPDDTGLCLLRRDGVPANALLGQARPPYTDWAWKDSGVRIGGPNMIRLPDGRLLAAARLYDGGARTSLLRVDPATAKLDEILRLPSGGDTSYPGLVWHRRVLWVSYYSSHEGKAGIYLARARIGYTRWGEAPAEP